MATPTSLTIDTYRCRVCLQDKPPEQFHGRGGSRNTGSPRYECKRCTRRSWWAKAHFCEGPLCVGISKGRTQHQEDEKFRWCLDCMAWQTRLNLTYHFYAQRHGFERPQPDAPVPHPYRHDRWAPKSQKLAPQDHQRIGEMFDGGVPVKEIARRYERGIAHIQHVLGGVNNRRSGGALSQTPQDLLRRYS